MNLNTDSLHDHTNPFPKLQLLEVQGVALTTALLVLGGRKKVVPNC